VNTPTYPPRYALYPGQGPLRKFGALSFLRAIPGQAALFDKEVPPEFWTEDSEEVPYSQPEIWAESSRVGVISCVCGEKPRARENRLTLCRCERVFLLLGDSIRVMRVTASDGE
jgi:hypothetical protein